MQEEPTKTVENYNEIRSVGPNYVKPTKGIIDIQSEVGQSEYYQKIAENGVALVNDKVDEILGHNNKLTESKINLPRVKIIKAYPGASGYFSPRSNEIAIITDAIGNNQLNALKVFAHEYIHFLSHNGRDDYERIGDAHPVNVNNNVGFNRTIGLDIRKGKEGKITGDYFLSFNEAVTEQLAIDVIPNVYETYSEYRGLLGQVIDDAVAKRIGHKKENGEFVSWSKKQLKDYIYSCYFKGDLSGFSNMLKTIYTKFNISEQQFGLMTNKDDLPSLIEARLSANHPATPPPLPNRVKELVQERIDKKTEKDYVTDVIKEREKADQNKYDKEYQKFVEDYKIAVSSEKIKVNNIEYRLDSVGFIIYRGEISSLILQKIRTEFDDLLGKMKNGVISKEQITERIDYLLFDEYRISMLSDGFREFYVYKHTKLGS